LHHAYIFSGARGVGKTTTARLLAKALNCHKSPTPTASPCRVDDPEACPSCREITESRSIDVQEIDAASNTGIDNVREVIIGTVGIAPARDRFKIFIIDEVHMLSTSSFNALLKTIEEPPPRVVFIMATTEKHKVPDTILSRSQEFEFRTIATTKILERLKLIANAEKISIADDALREIARVGEGSMRDAQSAFDQVISFAGEKIKHEDVEMALGVAGADVLTRVMNGIAEHKPAEMLSVIDDLVMRGHDLRNFCRDMLAHFRDLLVAKVSGSNELLESAVCERQELDRQAALFSESDLVRFFHSLAETENKLRTATHPRYQMEIGLMKLMEMRRLQPISELLERIAALETSLRTGQPLAPTNKTPGTSSGTPPTTGSSSRSSTPTAKAATSSAASAGIAPSATAVKLAIDPQDVPSLNTDADVSNDPAVAVVIPVSTEPTVPASLVDLIKTALEKRRKMFLVTALEGACLARLEESELYLEFKPTDRHLRDSLSKIDNVKILREACQEVMGREMGVRFAIKDQQADENAPLTREDEARQDKQRLREIAEQDPMVQQMLTTFRGEIADVQRIGES
jgi:DNA polymerase-3 subunit gamma/tau